MGEFFRFRVQLVGVKPPVFRRFLLTTKATFHQLHEAIQAACGWGDCHLFAFRHKANGPAIAGIPDNHGFGQADPDAKNLPLTKWFSMADKTSCVYEYDFGDGWLHDVKLEAIEQHDDKGARRLLEGARAFPPEDCGGLAGYEACVEVAAGGDDPDDLGEWLGNWNPEHFDMVGTKRKFDR